MRNDEAIVELILVIAGCFLLASAVLWLYIHWLWRGLFYAADKRAAEIVGTATILESMRKSRDAILALKGSTKRLKLLPNIKQRIRKLDKHMKP